MSAIQQLLTDHLDIWTAADTAKKSGRGRSSGNAGSVYGVKKLRELILELAVRGKLVTQDANDEPASELLKKIAAEKVKLVAEGKIKKSKPLAEITDDEKPFELPVGWEWTTLISITLINPRNNVEDDLQASFVPMTLIGTGFNSLHDQETRLWKEIKQGFTHFAEGDVGVAKITPCFENSKACVFSGLTNQVGAGTTELHIIRPINMTLSPRYILAYVKSPQFLLIGESKMTGTAGQKRLPKDFVESNLFPLPPIAEQHRIVAKVDELMALCDQLENQHNNAAEAHEKLVTHLLGTLTQSQNAEDFNTNWQRISEHFDTLFTTEASIDALKQTLLQLAVMGKLVPQDPNDEPASELLKRIQAEKAKLIAEGKIKKNKPLAAITDEEKPFDLPEGWEWVRKNEVFAFLNGYAFKSEWFESSGIKLLRNVNVSHGKANWSDPAYISIEQAANFNEYMLNVDDLVLSLDRPIITTGLKYAIISKADIPCLLLQRIAKVSSFCKVVDSEYLAIWLNSSFFVGNIDPGRSNGVPHISTTQVANMCFALPPTAEQWRIVAKVDELMVTCDQLKSRLTAANQLQQKIADAMVEQTTA
jgi:type I restriction enzyme S subunit